MITVTCPASSSTVVYCFFGIESSTANTWNGVRIAIATGEVETVSLTTASTYTQISNCVSAAAAAITTTGTSADLVTWDSTNRIAQFRTTSAFLGFSGSAVGQVKALVATSAVASWSAQPSSNFAKTIDTTA